MIMLFTLLASQLFHHPMRIETNAMSLLWVVPICLSIAVVYKAVKIETFSLPLLAREVVFLLITILGFLLIVALCLLGIARLVGI